MNIIVKPVIFAIILIFATIIPLNADTDNPENGSELFIYTETTKDADHWVQENGDAFIASAVVGTDNAYERYTQLSIGNGIRVINFDDPENEVPYYLYPVVDGTNIAYVLRVYNGKNGFEGIISQILTKELNQLALKTTASNPAMILLINENIILVQEGNADVLFASPDKNKVFDAEAAAIVEDFVDSINSSEKLKDFGIVNTTEYLAGVVPLYPSETEFIEKVLLKSTVINREEETRSTIPGWYIFSGIFVVLGIVGGLFIKKFREDKQTHR